VENEQTMTFPLCWKLNPVESMPLSEESHAAKEASTGEQDADAILMQSVATGDEAALRMLIAKWQNPLINFFYRSLNSRHQAEDLTQVLFIKIYQAAPRYQPTAKFSTYLFAIARRLLINEYRRSQRKPLEAVDPAELGGSVSGRQALETLEIEEAFQQALKELPENHREAILLFKQQELSYQEIAEIMNTTESSVKTWIFRARQRLKSSLKYLFEK
jgi:RNA polymerase sigma-70 factor (ECF subfamily)